MSAVSDDAVYTDDLALREPPNPTNELVIFLG
jgi:hypothetical protein